MSSRPEIKPPEPALTAADLLERAAAMRDEIRAEAPDNEQRGGYSPERHQAFTEAGFYRMLQPRRYGGYEIGMDEFLRVVMEVSRADQPRLALEMSLLKAIQLAPAASIPELVARLERLSAGAGPAAADPKRAPAGAPGGRSTSPPFRS